jgi:hypothetical protein
MNCVESRILGSPLYNLHLPYSATKGTRNISNHYAQGQKYPDWLKAKGGWVEYVEPYGEDEENRD